MCPFRAKLLAGVLIVVSAVAPVFAEQGSNIRKRVLVLTRLTSPPGDPVAESLASTITSSINLVMRLTGSITVDHADFLAPTAFLNRAVEYYHQLNADGAVYGSVARGNDGRYTIDLYIWNSAKGNQKPAVIHRSIENVLSLFEIADELSLRVASTVVGRELAEGTLVVSNLGGLKKYAVYADGHLLGRNRSSFSVLTGQREIAVAKPGLLGDVPIKVFHVQITKDHTTTISLSVAPQESRPTSPVRPTVKKGTPITPGYLKVTVSPQSSEEAYFTVIGPRGTKRFDLGEYGTERLELAPGSYRLTASLGADPGIGYRHTIRIVSGKYFSLDVPLDYTTQYKISQLESQRNISETVLKHTEAERRITGRRALYLTVSALAGGVLSGVSYIVGRNSYTSYQSATNMTTAIRHRTEVLTYSGLTIGGGVAATALLLWGLVGLHARPSAQQVLALRKSVSELDKQIHALAASAGGGT